MTITISIAPVKITIIPQFCGHVRVAARSAGP
jgi:hypothetical protein